LDPKNNYFILSKDNWNQSLLGFALELSSWNQQKLEEYNKSVEDLRELLVEEIRGKNDEISCLKNTLKETKDV
jgi:hypothetical protein